MIRRYRWWLSALVLVFVAALVGIFVFSGTETPRRQGPPGTGPLTLVSLGDSTLSGEGTGTYTPETDGANGNWCHRSPQATVHMTDFPGVTEKINLACSGAPAGQVALGDVKQYTEPSQAARLGELTRTHRIAAVVIAVGANDDPKFSSLVPECVGAWLNSDGQPCTAAIRDSWQGRVDAMVPKVEQAVSDVKKVLATAGYQLSDYQIVLQSYAAPIGPGIPESLRNLNGCPFRTEDLYWVSRIGVRELSEGLRKASSRAGARFLDLSRAGEGHQACSGGADPSTEWFSRLTFQVQDLADPARASHAVQESFHPNAAGHAQVGRCLTEFLATPTPAAACLPGQDGNLHAKVPTTIQ